MELIAGHVDRYPAHMRFIVRERHGGVQAVREAIRDQLARFTEEVAQTLATDPASAGWTEDDLLMPAQLYVDQMIATGCLFLEAPASAPATGPGERTREHVALTAARRLRLISIGRLHWLDHPAGKDSPGEGPPGGGTKGDGTAGGSRAVLGTAG